MKRLNSRKPLRIQIENEETVKKPQISQRSYSDVVAFGIDENASVNFKVSPSKQMLKRNLSAELFEAFPPLTDIESVSSDENDVIILNESNCSETIEEDGEEQTTYGRYLEKRFEVCGKDKSSEIEVNLRSILEIHIDDFNFTEVDDDPDSGSFPRFVGVFEDKDYLKLEKEVLQSFENLIF